MFGNGKYSNKIYLIDFGISKLHENNYLQFKKNRPFVGTTRFASVAAHKGEEVGRKDDLESLFYLLLFLINGIVPWQSLKLGPGEDRNVAVGDIKLTLELEELCNGGPKEFIAIFRYLRQLDFKTEPEYHVLTNFINKAAL